ncbi:hypothetical protein P879_02114 [Paragonimus westermani]|uniref:c-SKI SMAD4-binding domain-containing protein n=1 Tax=Paragonimus westermani TaxID=34504 RepID=A0A8T0D0H1_9TREM|nr:hypothetical protein P879_02114 [Paragonimus westermani]
MDGKQRLCLAQISSTLLKDYSYNEIHNRRVALGITCVQCSPGQLETLRESGAMPASSRRCGTITLREAERLVKSFLDEPEHPKLPENFAFDVIHHCGWGCRGQFSPARYNSSRAKCVRCSGCQTFLSPNKFIFHSHVPHHLDAVQVNAYRHPDAANFNAWRRHLFLDHPNPSLSMIYAWEDVKAMFNGGNRKRYSTQSSSNSETSSVQWNDSVKLSEPRLANSSTKTLQTSLGINKTEHNHERTVRSPNFNNGIVNSRSLVTSIDLKTMHSFSLSPSSTQSQGTNDVKAFFYPFPNKRRSKQPKRSDRASGRRAVLQSKLSQANCITSNDPSNTSSLTVANDPSRPRVCSIRTAKKQQKSDETINLRHPAWRDVHRNSNCVSGSVAPERGLFECLNRSSLYTYKSVTLPPKTTPLGVGNEDSYNELFDKHQPSGYSDSTNSPWSLPFAQRFLDSIRTSVPSMENASSWFDLSQLKHVISDDQLHSEVNEPNQRKVREQIIGSNFSSTRTCVKSTASSLSSGTDIEPAYLIDRLLM